MKNIKIIAVTILLMNGSYFFAQQTNSDAKLEEVKQRRIENNFRIATVEKYKMLNEKILELRSELKEAETRKKDFVNSERILKSTINKIEKLQAENQKFESKISASSITDEEIKKNRVKIKENEMSIQKLQLNKIIEQKELEVLISQL